MIDELPPPVLWGVCAHLDGKALNALGKVSKLARDCALHNTRGLRLSVPGDGYTAEAEEAAVARVVSTVCSKHRQLRLLLIPRRHRGAAVVINHEALPAYLNRLAAALPEGAHAAVQQLRFQELPVSTLLTPALASWHQLAHLELHAVTLRGDAFAFLRSVQGLKTLHLTYPRLERTRHQDLASHAAAACDSLVRHMPHAAALNTLVVVEKAVSHSSPLNVLVMRPFPHLPKLTRLELDAVWLPDMGYHVYVNMHRFFLNSLLALPLTHLSLSGELVPIRPPLDITPLVSQLESLQHLTLSDVDQVNMELLLQLPLPLHVRVRRGRPARDLSAHPCQLASLHLERVDSSKRGALSWLPLAGLAAPLKLDYLEVTHMAATEEGLKVLRECVSALASHFESHAGRVGRHLSLVLLMPLGSPHPLYVTTPEGRAALWDAAMTCLGQIEPFVHTLEPQVGVDVMDVCVLAAATRLGHSVPCLRLTEDALKWLARKGAAVQRIAHGQATPSQPTAKAQQIADDGLAQQCGEQPASSTVPPSRRASTSVAVTHSKGQPSTTASEPSTSLFPSATTLQLELSHGFNRSALRDTLSRLLGLQEVACSDSDSSSDELEEVETGRAGAVVEVQQAAGEAVGDERGALGTTEADGEFACGTTAQATSTGGGSGGAAGGAASVRVGDGGDTGRQPCNRRPGLQPDGARLEQRHTRASRSSKGGGRAADDGVCQGLQVVVGHYTASDLLVGAGARAGTAAASDRDSGACGEEGMEQEAQLAPTARWMVRVCTAWPHIRHVEVNVLVLHPRHEQQEAAVRRVLTAAGCSHVALEVHQPVPHALDI